MFCVLYSYIILLNCIPESKTFSLTTLLLERFKMIVLFLSAYRAKPLDLNKQQWLHHISWIKVPKLSGTVIKISIISISRVWFMIYMINKICPVCPNIADWLYSMYLTILSAYVLANKLWPDHLKYPLIFHTV